MAITLDNSNVTLSELDAYHTDRQTAAWLAADTATKTAAAIRATDYIAFTYTLVDGIDRTDAAVKRATMVLAVAALTSSLTDAATPFVTSEELTGVGSVTYADRGSYDPYPAVSSILRDVASRKSGTNFRNARVIL